MGRRQYQIAMYIIAYGMALTGVSLLIYELRNAVNVSPRFAPVASAIMLVLAMYLVTRAHRE